MEKLIIVMELNNKFDCILHFYCGKSKIKYYLLIKFKMGFMTIPEMNRKLEEVSQFFITQSKSFINKV